MKIKCGGTRLVLLIGDRAYKIARFRPFKTFKKIIVSVLIQTEFERLYEKHKSNKLQVVFKSLIAGLLANRAEWRKWNENLSEDFIPVSSIWLAGLVIVQPRATEASAEEVLSSSQKDWYLNDEELGRAVQYGNWNDRIVVVDYAHLGYRW